MIQPPLPVGLSEAEAARRLAEEGPNDLPSDREHGCFRAMFDIVRETMLLLLLGAATIYFVLGAAQ